MFGHWVLLFLYLLNGKHCERIITHNEELLKTVKHEQDLTGKKITTWVYKALESQNQDDFQMCYDETYHLVYIFSIKTYETICHLSVYMVELQNHNISLVLHGIKDH
ncbi:hypothetical protein RF11_01801 [Thelohanellus kitauei]|uniref:Ubiquitin-like protease family profile domain-containing protein n=1 Tax=Thelohanellus kitauei TaxID=669202 RepID=A0A0C2NJF8_THEKT|nr:hypothetical protein RF11_01801 [Thelohanellus kitauei]